MSKFRWLIALLCIFSLVAAACGDDDDDDTSTEEPTEDTAEEPAEEPAEEAEEPAEEEPAEEEPAEEEPAEEAGGDLTCGANTADDVRGIDKDAGVFKIGTSQPFTGVAATAGEGLLAGIQIAVDEVNAAGGIDGCMFELAWEDDRFEIEQMVTNVRKLIEEDQVWGFVGTAGSQAIPSTYPDIEDAGTPLWGPVSPADQNIQQVYLLGPTRTEQGRICIDYFAEQGATTMAVIGQNNELGDEGNAAADLQAEVAGLEVVAREEVEVLSEAVAPAVLAVIDSGAEAVLTAVDNQQNALIMDQFFEAGFDPLICSDAGAAGTGGPNTVQLANPDAADGFLGTLQTALPESDDPFINNWRDLADAYDGPGAEGGRNFNLQTYSYTVAFFDVIDSLDGDYSYESFHAAAEALEGDPIVLSSIPQVACGPLPGGHSCASGAGLAQYNAGDDPDGDGVGTWSQVRDFQPPQS